MGCLSKGTNHYTITFAPDKDYKPSEKERLSSYDKVKFELVEERETKNVYEIKVENIDKTCNDLFIDIDYQGDCAKLFIQNEYVEDHFYTGEKWEIGLKRFDFKTELRVEIMPLKEGTEIFLEHWPEMKEGKACNLGKVAATYEYRTIIEFDNP